MVSSCRLVLVPGDEVEAVAQAGSVEFALARWTRFQRAPRLVGPVVGAGCFCSGVCSCGRDGMALDSMHAGHLGAIRGDGLAQGWGHEGRAHGSWPVREWQQHKALGPAPMHDEAGSSQRQQQFPRGGALPVGREDRGHKAHVHTRLMQSWSGGVVAGGGPAVWISGSRSAGRGPMAGRRCSRQQGPQIALGKSADPRSRRRPPRIEAPHWRRRTGPG